MTQENYRQTSTDTRPWYKEPWPWVVIAIPASAVIMGIITLYLALTHPDQLVVDEKQYREITSELRAQQQTTVPNKPGSESSRDNGDGDH